MRTPSGRSAAYAAAVVEAVPRTARGRRPGYRLRLLGALLIRTPDAPQPRGGISALTVARVSAQRLRFKVRVTNRGGVHGYPENLRVRLTDSRGRTVLERAPRTGVVLPGYRRDCPLDLFRRLRAGTYTAEATGQFGSVRSRAVVDFTVAPGNRVRSVRRVR
ncbi:MAG: hypothetical protein H0V40_10095 [Actinobacteria bacterium]|nr:hypothetical protein [Actinomycetota bacterium]